MASTQTLRKRLSLFAFLDKGKELPAHDGVNPKDTDNNDEDGEDEAPLSYQPNGQLSSPINSPVSQSIGSLPDADSSIFERSVQDGVFEQSVPKCKRCSGKKSCGHNSSVSSSGLMRNEDMVPAALDATTSLLSDNQTNLDQVEMIYPSRRNSSVLSLNKALGRTPTTTSRKNSSVSMKLGGPVNNGGSVTSPGGNNSGLSSPPRLHSSKSSLSFYSYADMINNDEFARRPSIKHSSTSQGFVPLSKSNFPRYSNSIKKAPTSQLLSLFNNNKLDKFMISPESSDDEENASIPSKRKSMSSANSNTNSNNMFNDNESLVSSTVGDCLRMTNTEINGV